MDQNLKKIIPFLKPYKSNVVWNIIFNILYALFSTLSFIALIPMLDVLFKDADKVIVEPKFSSIWEIGSFGKEFLYYYITKLTNENGDQYALLLVVTIIIITFLLKNLFNYLALNHLLLVKNGVLKDIRNKMFDKIIDLPVSYYSEKRKGDVMARMLNDVNEVRNSFFSILELVVKEPMTIIFTIAFMIAISFKLTLFVFIFIPISGFIISKIGKSLKANSKKAQDENGYLISIVEETLGGLKVVKRYNA
jgi:subfamily B ATP-binding cassette protein MsbA